MMNKTTASLLAGMTVLAFTAGSVSAQVLDLSNVLVGENFDSLTPNEAPPSLSSGANMLWEPQVVVDSGDLFGHGTSNQYLSFYKTRNVTLPFNLNSQSTDILRVSFSMIPRNNPADTFEGTEIGTDAQWMGVDLRTEANTRAHITQFNPFNATTRGVTPNVSFGQVDVLVAIDIFFNNSNSSITHLAPDGVTEITLGANMATIWTDGSLLVGDYNFARATGTGGQPIHIINFAIDSNTTRIVSYDIDDIAIYGAIPEPSTYALIFGGLALAGAFYARRRRS